MNGLKPRGRKAWDLFLSCLSSLRAGISFDFAGNPGWNLEMRDIKTPSITLDEIFYYLEKADKPCLVAIDEFQAIAKYPEKILKLYCVPIFSIAQMQDLFMQVPTDLRKVCLSIFDSAFRNIYACHLAAQLCKGN